MEGGEGQSVQTMDGVYNESGSVNVTYVIVATTRRPKGLLRYEIGTVQSLHDLIPPVAAFVTSKDLSPCERT